MSTPQLLDVAGRRRSPATLPGSRAGRPPRNKGFRYVVGKLQKAGYAVTVQPFTFPFFKELAPPIFERTAPTARTYVEGTDFQSMEYSGCGDVTGGVVATNDIVIPPGATAGSSNSGCEAS